MTVESAGVAIVTGAARGIGAATVLELVNRGWSVTAVDWARDDPAVPYAMASTDDLAALVRAADARSARPGSVLSVVADVRDVDALAGAVAATEERWGGLDVAVAAAGVIVGGVPHWRTIVEQERAVLEIDLGGVMNLARVAVPALLRRPVPRSGRFLAVASAAATRGFPMLAAYCAAKAGVTGFVRSLANELGGTGATANAVSPGSTDTSILVESARLYGMSGSSQFALQQPLGRLIEPREIASVLAFLAGPGSGAMTGAVVDVDGGLSL